MLELKLPNPSVGAKSLKSNLTLEGSAGTQ